MSDLVAPRQLLAQACFGFLATDNTRIADAREPGRYDLAWR